MSYSDLCEMNSVAQTLVLNWSRLPCMDLVWIMILKLILSDYHVQIFGKSSK